MTLRARPAAVWRALTEGELLARWLGAEAELDARPGGGGYVRLADGTRCLLRVDVAEPERRLVLRWCERGAVAVRHGVPSVVELLLWPDGEGTRLVVTETALADDPSAPGSGLDRSRTGAAL